MADTKQSALADMLGVDVADDDGLGIRDKSNLSMSASGTNEEIDISELVIALQRRGMPRVKRLDTQHSVSTTAATKVTGLDMALEAGTYAFDYRLLVQASLISSGPQFNLNFSTGTVTKKGWWFQYADLSSTLLAAIGTMAHDTSTATLGFQMAKAEDDFATTAAGNMGPTATTNDVQTINTDVMATIKGLLVVTVAGTLELWHGSFTANATTVEVGSSLIVVRTDLDPT